MNHFSAVTLQTYDRITTVPKVEAKVVISFLNATLFLTFLTTVYIPLLSVAHEQTPPHCENTEVFFFREAITELGLKKITCVILISWNVFF